MTISKIAPAFIAAKKQFSPALKDKTNPAFKSRYADLSACLDAVDDAFLANDIALYQETFEDSSGVTVETVLLHSSGESLRFGKLHVPASKQDPQGYGSALTYARRYSVLTACGIAPEDDDGNAASKPAIKSAPVAAKPVMAIDANEMSIINMALREAESLKELQDIFGPAYTRASDTQKVIIKTAYDNIKITFTEETA